MRKLTDAEDADLRRLHPKAWAMSLFPPTVMRERPLELCLYVYQPLSRRIVPVVFGHAA